MEWLLEHLKDFWWRPRFVADANVPRLSGLLRELSAITGRQNMFAIVGGSYALRLCTGREFPVSDIDIVLPAIDADRRKTRHVTDPDLHTEARFIESVYETTAEVRYRRDVTEADIDEEAFDEYIIGTVNIVHKGTKLQFIFVNLPLQELIPWYIRVSDLPMFLEYQSPETIFVHYKSKREARRACQEGHLTGFHHARRVEKYRAKGFTVDAATCRIHGTIIE